MSNTESCVRYKKLMLQKPVEGRNDKPVSCQSDGSSTVSFQSTESYQKEPSPENGDVAATGDGLSAKNSEEICRCNFCRTEWLTGKLTLKCYYCESGFLINPSDHFVCIGCQKSLSSLSFVVRLCKEIEETFHYWENDFYTKELPDYALVNMETNYNELLNCISGDNLRIVQLTLQLAKAYNAKKDFVKAAQLNHRAIRTMLGYQLSSVVDWMTLKESLACVDSIRQEHCEQIEANNIEVDTYLADAKELQLKVQTDATIQLE